jgi:hypothetical protein
MPTVTNASPASSPCGKAHHYEVGQCLACRVAELTGALRNIVETAEPTLHHADCCVVRRQFLGEARELMESVTK